MTDPKPETAVTYHGVNIPDSAYLGPQRIRAIRRKRYEAQEINAALRCIGESDRVLELGAGLGIVGAVIAHNCRPERIESYEANPDLIPVIKSLHSLNDLPNMAIHNAVVSAEDTPPATLPFYIHGSFLGSSLRPRRRARATVDVEVVPYKQIKARLAPTAIVMDIEGGEEQLLPHMDLEGVRLVSLELHPAAYGTRGVDLIFSSLMQQGFSYDTTASHGPVVTFQRDVS